MLKIAVFVSGGGTDLQSVIDAIEANQINGLDDQHPDRYEDRYSQADICDRK